MGWTSLLPESFAVVETWATRIFLLLGFLTIGPWAFLIVYDVALYIWRTAAYEFPLVGKQRPRAPSLKERANGRPRTFSLRRRSGVGGGGIEGDEDNGEGDGGDRLQR